MSSVSQSSDPDCLLSENETLAASKGPPDYSAKQKASILLAGFILSVFAIGTDLSSGIVYAKLLDPPCSSTVFVDSNSTDSPTSATMGYARNDTTRTQSTAASFHDRLGGRLDANMSSRLHFNSSVPIHQMTRLPAPIGTTTTAPPDRNVSGSEKKGCGGFGEGLSETAWVASIYTSVRCASGPIPGILADSFSIRSVATAGTLIFLLGTIVSTQATQLYHLYLTTVVTGVGASISIVMSQKLIVLAFPSRILLALSIIGTGVGSGIVIYALLGAYFVEEFGWRGFYYVAIALGSSSLVCLLLFFPSNVQVDSPKTDVSGSTERPSILQTLLQSVRDVGRGFLRGCSLYREGEFRIMLLVMSTYSLAVYFPLVFVAERAKDFGADEYQANQQLAAGGAAMIAGVIIICAGGSFLGLRPIFMQSLSLFALGGATILVLIVNNYTGLFISLLVFSFFSGPCAIFCTPALEQALKSPEKIAHGLGHSMLWSTIPMLIGPPLAGILHDATGTYTAPYLTGGAVLVLSGVMELFADRYVEKRKVAVRKSTSSDKKSKPGNHICMDFTKVDLQVSSL